ncbi:hypothetical protein SNE40_013348 [Patella caerulea]
MVLSIVGQNINGLRSLVKINDVLAHFRRSANNVIVLQETFWVTDLIERYIKPQWEGDMVFDNYNVSKRRGEAILCKKNVKIISSKSNGDGRTISAVVKHDDIHLNIIAYYAPNQDSERCISHKSLNSFVHKVYPNIILGDFNDILNPILDMSFGMKIYCKRSSSILENFIQDFNLVDIWRYRNPDKNSIRENKMFRDILNKVE